MAMRWRKSLHCRNNAVDDVVRPLTLSSASSSSTKKPLVSCGGNTSDAVKDVVFLFPKSPSSSSSLQKKPKPRPAEPFPSPALPARVVRVTRSDSFPMLAELPPGHSSRRVVEIIFSSSWCSSGVRSTVAAGFHGEIEMLFRVHSPAWEVARFEEHRAAVRARSHGEARCAADGNEMMRFHCGGAAGGVYDARVGRSAVWCGAGSKVEGVRTFAGSGRAHASGGGGGGRRAMLVCRVIAGRVRSVSDTDSAAESVSLGNGELVVLDPRAVLPCFLIIYRL